MPNGPIIFLDVDGVLADFIGGVGEHLGKRPLYEDPNANLPRGYISIGKIYGTSEEHAWSGDSFGFWTGLKKTYCADQIMNYVNATGLPYYFLTAPSKGEHCVRGKIHWLQKHYDAHRDQIIFTNQKHLLAAPSRILLEDHPDNLSKWNFHGGADIKIYQPWNCMDPADDLIHERFRSRPAQYQEVIERTIQSLSGF